MKYLRLTLSMACMYDAPLISPENKDSSDEIFASLPKVVLSADVTAEHSVSEAVKKVLDTLQSNNVIYAELRLNPADFAESLSDASLADALQQATTAIHGHAVDARIILTAHSDAAHVAEIADAAIDHDEVAGFALVGDNIDAHAGVLKKLQDNFVPFVIDGGFDDIEAGVKAGATRVAVGVDIIDDFSATVEGIEPGQLTSWIRDRHIAVETNPDEDIAQDDVDSLADHPLPLLQQLGFTCAVGTTALTQQFVSLNESLGYGLEEFFELTVAAMQNSFSTQEHRQHLIETVILPAYEELSDAEFAEDAAAREAEEAEEADDE